MRTSNKNNSIAFVIIGIIGLISIAVDELIVLIEKGFLFILNSITNARMTEGVSKSPRKKKNSRNNQQKATIVHKNLVDANWTNFLENNLIMDEKKPKQEDPNKYTGLFRRERKKQLTKSLAEQITLGKTVESNEISDNKSLLVNGQANRNNKNSNLTKFVAMDCEMVGVGLDGIENMLARVSIVNKFGDCVYDKFVKAREEVKDYRTNVSGVRREDMLNGDEFSKVQREVAEILKGRVLVGHSVKHDLAVLFLSHPKKSIRDTSRYKPFKKITNGGTPSLKRLTKEFLGVDIQEGEHNSIEDARATMKLYCMVAKRWEEQTNK